ncbi:MAG TPA: helix-turn-helix domain-containing protein [Nocardioidaceae bacterium]|jgi:AcrR family transcriptional regulator
MSSTVKRVTAPKRTYDATRRREQAEQTRIRVLETARDLFIEKGYGRTTVAEIARGAGVSAETVYATFRNKPTLLRHVWYTTFRGDDNDIRLLHRPEIEAVLAEPDLSARFRMHARVMAPVMRRFTPLLRALEAAAAHESAAADMVAEFDDMRLDACQHFARAAAATGRLGVSQAECVDVLYTALDGHLWHRLVAQRGWSDESFANWLGKLLVDELVK